MKYFKGISNINSVIYGKLTSQYCLEPHILVTDKPTFKNIKQITKSNAVIFTSRLAPYCHETILFKDYFIPSISNVDSQIIKSLGAYITFYSKNGAGKIYFDKLDILNSIEETRIDCAFTVSLR